MPYSYDMSNEKPVKVKKLLDEGWRKFCIDSCEPSMSKKGNEMFIIGLRDVETGYTETVYPIATQGKRWFLKQILAACGLPASQDGIYEWSEQDIIGKEIAGLVEHEESDWINREGQNVKTKQNRIADFKAVDEVIEWDHDK